MVTLFVVLAVAAILFGASVVATQEKDVLVEVLPDDADVELPTGRMVAEDLRAVRFAMVLRGYRMDEVDRVLERLGEELAARDQRIADLERVLAEIVEPAVEEAEAQRAVPEPEQKPELEFAEAQVPTPPPSLAPTLAQGARVGEAPAEAPAPAPAPDLAASFHLEAAAASVVVPAPEAAESPAVEAEPEPVEPAFPDVEAVDELLWEPYGSEMLPPEPDSDAHDVPLSEPEATPWSDVAEVELRPDPALERGPEPDAEPRAELEPEPMSTVTGPTPAAHLEEGLFLPEVPEAERAGAGMPEAVDDPDLEAQQVVEPPVDEPKADPSGPEPPR